MPIPLSTRIATIVPTITGWCSVEKANDLALAIIKLRAATSLEIGVWGGRSLIPMALAHAEQDHGIVIGIDPWSPIASAEGYEKVNADWWGSQNHELVYQNFLANLRAHNVEKFVKVIREKSDDVEPPKDVGLLHVDGQHSDQAVRDVERFAVNVIPGGFVFVDDIHWSGGGPERAVAKLLTMGFRQIFVRDTGAMFQREEAKMVGRRAKTTESRKPGRPKGSKNKKKAAA